MIILITESVKDEVKKELGLVILDVGIGSPKVSAI